MKKGIVLFFVSAAFITFGIVACKPINIFSPLVNPSKMGTDAQLDAGYNELASGNYDDAIDYFSDVINSASGDTQVDAYIGRGSAYMHIAAPNLDDVVSDIMNGNNQAGSTGDIIGTAVGTGEYDDFFDNIQNAADDYNSALDNSSSDVDPGILLEAYQSNMMAATGVGTQKIADSYNNGNSTYSDIWSVNTSNPVATTSYGQVTLNMELEAITTNDRLTTDDLYHPYNIDTWSDSTPANNGLMQFVDGTAKTEMMSYLTNAFSALEQLKTNPPAGMIEADITDMETGINDWVTNGLGETAISL